MPEAGDMNASGPVKNGSEATFMKDVIEESRNAPVLVYFSAAWCGPCKTFGPLLEKSVREAGGRLSMVKIDVDASQRIAAQMGIQSIPAVFAFVDGKPIDGFMGAKSRSEISEFVGNLIGSGEGDDLDGAIEQAEALLSEGAAVEAAQLFASVLSSDQENAAAYSGLVRACLELGDVEKAEAMLNSVPDAISATKEIAAAGAAIELARQAASAGPEAEIRTKLESNPDDHQARLDLAMSLHAAGKSADAIDELLELFRRDREWQDGAARVHLMQIFDLLKPNDPVALRGRRKLSSMIFA